ncbi:MAG TPA: hypothetical protein VFD82_04425 [Planctomycetota bacterium]|nr:hypothetical protein [Planctomycetota bacterium]
MRSCIAAFLVLPRRREPMTVYLDNYALGATFAAVSPSQWR